MIILYITVIAAILRFVNLMWGNGHFFNPDESNMARSIAQMTLAKGLHPDFFAYGQFPLYLAYFSYQIEHFISTLLHLFFPSLTNSEPTILFFSSIPFPKAIFWLRFWSAVSSTATVPLVYLITKELINTVKKPAGNHATRANQYIPTAAGLMMAFLPGAIQSAHFGTTESMLTFFFTVILYCSLRYLRTHKRIALVAAGITAGIALGTKITALSFLIAPIFAVLITPPILAKPSIYNHAAAMLKHIMLIVILAGIFFLLSSPYTLFDYRHFIDTSRYETQVATGGVQVFYTRQFINTIPIVFQFTRIFPYSLGLLLYIGSIISIILSFSILIKSSERLLKSGLFMLIISSGFYLLTNAFLFIKWTRFTSPLNPFFIIIFCVVFALYMYRHSKSLLIYIFFSATVFTTVLQGAAFTSIYLRDDVRITSSKIIFDTIAENSYILSETANVVDIPLEIITKTDIQSSTSSKGYTVISFDFYALDENPKLQQELADHLVKADYIFVPSRRIFKNALRLNGTYPLLEKYYNSLFSSSLGFEQIKTMDSFPSLGSLLRFPDENAEETWTVFDHPVIRIFKKTTAHDKLYYQNLLGIPSKPYVD